MKRLHRSPPICPLRRHLSTSTSSSSSSSSSPASPIDITALQKTMRSRPRQLIFDHLTPQHSHLLTLSLSDFLPRECLPPAFTASPTPLVLPHTTAGPTPGGGAGAVPLPPGHHLLYFPPQLPPSGLLPDGTDPMHSPGPPFSRRMWAGGSVAFGGGGGSSSDGRGASGLRLDGARAVCIETIGDVALRGGKVFVDVWRRYGALGAGGRDGDDDEAAAVEAVARAPAIEERRTLVFLRDEEGGAAEAEAQTKAEPAPRVVKAPFSPDYAFSLTPPPALLFHFSALSYNAHAIHLDRRHARDLEGHRDLLVHGPLSLALMLAAVQAPAPSALVRRVEYRNLAPLYAREPLRVCVRRNPRPRQPGTDACADDGARWDVWVEGPEGGLAVRGSVVTAGPA